MTDDTSDRAAGPAAGEALARVLPPETLALGAQELLNEMTKAVLERPGEPAVPRDRNGSFEPAIVPNAHAGWAISTKRSCRCLITCCDGLTGLPDTIRGAFPDTVVNFQLRKITKNCGHFEALNTLAALFPDRLPAGQGRAGLCQTGQSAAVNSPT